MTDLGPCYCGHDATAHGRCVCREPRLTHGATQSQIRDWARTQGLDVNPRGTVRRDIADAYAAAHQETP